MIDGLTKFEKVLPVVRYVHKALRTYYVKVYYSINPPLKFL